MSENLSCAQRWPRAVPAGLVAALLAACNSMPTVQGGGSSSAPTVTTTAPAAPTCERLPTMSNSTKTMIGTGLGVVVGYALGNATAGGNKGKSRTVGALGGALVGALASSAFKNEIDVEEQPDGSVKLKIPGSIMFASGQYSLSQGFQSTLGSVTSTIKKYCDITVKVVGHTDSVGALQSNMVLSDNRAKAVVHHMQSLGFDRARMTFEGRGPHEPAASNIDEAGRQKNRRVEIFVRPPSA